MRWMGGWGYEQLANCPDEIVAVILELMVEVSDGNK